MKLKKIESICKSSKQIIAKRDGDGLLWLGNGAASYLYGGLAYIEKEPLFIMFDIQKDKREGFYYSDSEVFDVPDICDGEEVVEKRSCFSIQYHGASFEPIFYSKGCLFINSKYFEPLDDEEDYGIYIRSKELKDGIIADYVVIKRGLIPIATIAPAVFSNELLKDEIYKVYKSLI